MSRSVASHSGRVAIAMVVAGALGSCSTAQPSSWTPSAQLPSATSLTTPAPWTSALPEPEPDPSATNPSETPMAERSPEQAAREWLNFEAPNALVRWNDIPFGVDTTTSGGDRYAFGLILLAAFAQGGELGLVAGMESRTFDERYVVLLRGGTALGVPPGLNGQLFGVLEVTSARSDEINSVRGVVGLDPGRSPTTAQFLEEVRSGRYVGFPVHASIPRYHSSYPTWYGDIVEKQSAAADALHVLAVNLAEGKEIRDRDLPAFVTSDPAQFASMPSLDKVPMVIDAAILVYELQSSMPALDSALALARDEGWATVSADELEKSIGSALGADPLADRAIPVGPTDSPPFSGPTYREAVEADLRACKKGKASLPPSFLAGNSNNDNRLLACELLIDMLVDGYHFSNRPEYVNALVATTSFALEKLTEEGYRSRLLRFLISL